MTAITKTDITLFVT